MPRAWVCQMLNKHKEPYEYQVIYKARALKAFKSREKAEEFAKMVNLLIKEFV